MSNRIDPKILRNLLRYEPETGKLFWLPRSVSMFPSVRIANSWNSRFSEKEAFTTKDTNGYMHGKIFGKTYRVHRVAFAILNSKWPTHEIDHINGDTFDNRLCNLREASHAENLRNMRLRRNNKSGFKGVSWFARDKKWVAQIRANGKAKNLGLYDSPEEAHAVYMAAARKYYGEFSREK